jgi:hypothetical protein
MGAETVAQRGARKGEGGMISYDEAVALTAQNMGRTGPISANPGGASWASLLVIALLCAVISAVVAGVSVRHGMRRLGWGWTVASVLSALASAYFLLRLA